MLQFPNNSFSFIPPYNSIPRTGVFTGCPINIVWRYCNMVTTTNDELASLPVWSAVYGYRPSGIFNVGRMWDRYVSCVYTYIYPSYWLFEASAQMCYYGYDFTYIWPPFMTTEGDCAFPTSQVTCHVFITPPQRFNNYHQDFSLRLSF